MTTLAQFLRNPISTLTSVEAGNPPLHLPVEQIFGEGPTNYATRFSTPQPRPLIKIDHSTPFEVVFNRPANTINQV